MKVTTAWLLSAGLKAGLTRAETLNSTPGEIQDLCACRAIFNGAKQKIRYSSDETDAR